MYGLLSGKTAIVTGSRKGMGWATVELFANEGADIIACARKPDMEFQVKLEELAEKTGKSICPMYFDFDNVEEIKAVAKILVSEKKPIDILVNNAGISINALYQMSSADIIMRQYNSNFLGPILFSQYITKIMAKYGGGSIINISSTAGIDGNQGRLGYGASKASVICATKVMAKELAVKNIRVNAIAPGITRTDMIGNMSDEIIHETLAQSCLKRMGEPEEVARVSLFLASGLSSYITGQTIRVDGGMF
ncbi:SDR family oxidoreductase [uncultured Sphaerochaeta sp.]|uniref:SDR family NAD(P)-dependent oxidoreductase n=1 Tax=uncultured Sphaerochaeta sp. TaxID=886478 RepID=UPI002A0A5F45|nr:SDR family oxidoreductase [uncultured Sphaerochaeta sp.]